MHYARGKVYFIKGPSQTCSTALQSTDVTVAVDCGVAMPLVAPSFENWPISETQLGMAEDATPHSAKTEYLHETSPLVAGLPWDFKAYRKVIKFNGTLVSLTM